MEVQDSTFQVVKEVQDEGLVMLGAGGDSQEWIDGVSGILVGEGIATPEFEFKEAYLLKTTGGRTDLVLTFDGNVDVGRLAMWRLRFGDCSWLSDYVVNYSEQHL